MSQDYIVFGSPTIEEDEVSAVAETLRSCWIGTGPRVQQFEAEFAQYIGARHAVAVNSCTAALHLSLLAAGVQRGDEVITTPMTFAATSNTILHAGATPVFVDVDRRSMNIDVNRIEQAITPKTRAILPVHFAGRPCDMDAIETIARHHGLAVIEDAAHCIEGAVRGRKIGTISRFTCFSFYATKNMTTGEGGMVCTDDQQMADRIKVTGLHGLSRDAWKRFSDEGYRHYQVVYPGFKYNMMDIQAAIGLCQLPRLPKWLQRREEIWARYDAAFADLPCYTPDPPPPDTVHARHLYTLLLDLEGLGRTRDQVMAELHTRGIGTGVHYLSVHLHEFYRERFGFKPEDYPEAAWISERTLSLPLSPKLSDPDVDRIIGAVREVVGASVATSVQVR